MATDTTNYCPDCKAWKTSPCEHQQVNNRKMILNSQRIDEGAAASDIANLRVLVTLLEDKVKRRDAFITEFEAWLAADMEAEMVREAWEFEWNDGWDKAILEATNICTKLKAKYLGTQKAEGE